MRRRTIAWSGLALATVALGWQATATGPAEATGGDRFEFRIVESFDARYLGDTPGHLGRGGGIDNGRKVDVALGDPVYRGRHRVGTISNLIWDRAKGSLEVEFDPSEFEVDPGGQARRRVRLSIGETVWISLAGLPAEADAPATAPPAVRP